MVVVGIYWKIVCQFGGDVVGFDCVQFGVGIDFLILMSGEGVCG